MPNDLHPSPIDPLTHLPLTLLGSDPIPPAPTRSRSIDFLNDFAGYSWVAYGAASLLVISHFPSPLSPDETLVGPVIRQTFELSASHDEVVEAVAWSPKTPSDGDVAAACGNCVLVFRNVANWVQGSFCWSQNVVLLQSTKVEAIEWTGSGDGIVAGGPEVVLWIKRNQSWEIAWKFKADQPQTMLSATWSIVGPSASVTSICDEVYSKRVSLYYGDGKHQYVKTELHHPQSVTSIQWRRSVGRQLDSDAGHFLRNVLLTCCMDGTARLWCEIYDGRSRKVGKGNNDHKRVRRTFSVAAVIDVNRMLNGTLGSDVFLMWANEVKGIFNTSNGGKKIFSNEDYDCDNVGACEWLVGYGPGMLVSYWPIHCLDDISPMRFPRVMLWKKQKIKHSCLQGDSLPRNQEPLLLNEAIIARNCLSGPPALSSIIHQLPSSCLAWSVFYSQLSNTSESSQDNSNGGDFLTSSATGVLKLSGHTGKILQVAVHPHVCELELAASLDSNGGLLFWSFANINSCNAGFPNLLPAWELCGELVSRNFCSKYTSLCWAPSILDEDRFLFMGHVKGIDCFIVRFFQTSKQKIECSHFCTIPLTGHGPYNDGPTDIFTVPLASTSGETLKYNRFMLLGVWMKGFEGFSWEVTLHSHNSSESYGVCKLDKERASGCNVYNFESAFSGHSYCISVDPCSSFFPDIYANDEVTSFAVVCTTNLTHMPQLGFSNNSSQNFSTYIMATGCADGTFKLWRSEKASLTTPSVPWELVGLVAAHTGPVLAICIDNCGQKIATIGGEDHLTVLKIWDAVHLTGLGGYVLEDTITLDKLAVSLKWLTLGNGQSLLGVCMENEFQVYAQSRYGVHALTSARSYNEVPNWSCVAVAHVLVPIHNFVWGPRATAIIIHHSYFTLFGQSLFLSDKSYYSKLHPLSNGALDCEEEMLSDHFSSVFTDSEVGDYRILLQQSDSRKLNARPHLKIDNSESCLCSSFLMAWAQTKRGHINKQGLWSVLEVVESLGGNLPVYHPEALLANICSGNWKRAIVSLRHLSESLNSIDSQKRNGPGKYHHIIPQILLSKYFEQTITKATDKGQQWGTSSSLTASTPQVQTRVNLFALTMDSGDSSDMLSPSSAPSELCDLSEILEKNYELAVITEAEKLKILAIVDLLSEVSDPQSVSAYASLDESGRRYWVVLRFQQLLFNRKFGRKPALEELIVDSGLIGWAFHSDCQENLFDCLLPSEPSWQQMRSLGVGYWFTNETELRKRMEKLARMQYLKKRDPKDCALLYVALNRIQVLAGLFKISRDEKDKPLVAFLSRNFQDEKNKAAALKNAYVLLGRHQFELAIAFFLLGGDAFSAITVCAKNLGDEQLALVICRLVEGSGGQLQRHLITKILIPLAIEKNDYWLASLLEWELGNYSQSFSSMMGLHTTSVTNKLAVSTNHIAFADPNIGLYCQTLAANYRMRNAVGEQDAAILAMWANFMTETALRRSGLLLEALEFHSSSLSGSAILDGATASKNEHSEVLLEVLKPSSGKSSNWLLHDVSIFLESYAKSDMALLYISKLIKEHPNWSESLMGGFHGSTEFSKEYRLYPNEKLYGDFRLKLCTVLGEFEQMFSLIPTYLLSMAFRYTCNTGMMFIGYDILHGYTSQNDWQSKQQLVDSFFIYLYPYKPLQKVMKELSLLSSRFILSCSMTCTHQAKLGNIENDVSGEITSNWSDMWRYDLRVLLLSCWNLKASLRILAGHPKEDIISESLDVLDLVKYYLYLSSAWLNRNSRVILLMVQPLNVFGEGHTPTPGKVNSVCLKKLIYQNEELLANHLLNYGPKMNFQVSSSVHNRNEEIMPSIPEDELWHTIGACLWQRMVRFLKSQSVLDLDNPDYSCSNGAICNGVGNLGPPSGESQSDSDRAAACIKLVSEISMKLLKSTLVHLSSFQTKQLALLLRNKVENGTYTPTLSRLEQSCHSSSISLGQKSMEESVTQDTMTTEDELLCFRALCSIYDDSTFIAECFMIESIDWLQYFKHKTSKGWMDFHKYISKDRKNEDIHEGKIGSYPAKTETVSHNQNQTKNSHTSIMQQETALINEVNLFQKPKEVYKRNGELLEALCTNSINQQEAAVATNRKGIVFFSWEDGMPSLDQADYIWTDADWPHDGWAGSQSTPVPTFVSPGVGLGSNKGAHLGLGGATIGVGSFGRPQKSLSGGGAFGVPGYAGTGASGLGWEVQADFEEFSDPPATVENIVTRAFFSHPSLPFFLVGSVNTHIYLWEFGKDTATATYGVMPAANVPPPYALASISALQFDHFGHRFASAALDGTICTWQLEVGGRSNIYPTESSLCFNNHARDVTFVTSSGSIVAAAGYSSNGVNVVVWDTLAPPTTSRASIICHEGGARSISVFDNDIGSGSVSPFIVTGGKTGDVGLHDFRYIATGKTKRHRQGNDNERSTNLFSDSKHGEQNANGMLWYIPKAHSGNVAKVATIPNTSLFLTGSKDGDVKLWDAKKARLVHHWPKLHERHTFLQPSSSRGFGEVVRAGVTDIQIMSHGFLTCGGDGSVKSIQFKDYKH